MLRYKAMDGGTGYAQVDELVNDLDWTESPR